MALYSTDLKNFCVSKDTNKRVKSNIQNGEHIYKLYILAGDNIQNTQRIPTSQQQNIK